MGGGDDADDVTTEMVGPARTIDAASAMMEAVAKVHAALPANPPWHAAQCAILVYKHHVWLCAGLCAQWASAQLADISMPGPAW